MQQAASGLCSVCHTARATFNLAEWAVQLCPDCLPGNFEKRLKATIQSQTLFRRGEKVLVAVSGGKDSAALLAALARLKCDLYFHLHALHVDMGLGDYSQRSLEAVQALCERFKVPLEVLRAADYGVEVRATRQWPVCAICGGIRRALFAREVTPDKWDAFALAHTLEDQLQTLLKNLLSGKYWLPQPKLEASPHYARKIKPFYFFPEDATAAYAQVLELPYVKEECPLFDTASHDLKRVGQTLGEVAPGAKLIFLHNMRKLLSPPPADEGEWRPCTECGAPTPKGTCDLCRIRLAQQAD